MAKNYKICEIPAIVDSFIEGSREEEIISTIKRFPELCIMIAAGCLDEILECITFASALQFNNAIRKGSQLENLESADEEQPILAQEPTEEQEVEVDVIPKEQAQNLEPKKRGRGRPPKATAAPEPEPEEEEIEEIQIPPEPKQSPYVGLTAKQLYDRCCEKNLKVEIRKPAEYYIAKLEALAKKIAEEAAALAKKRAAEAAKKAADDDWDNTDGGWEDVPEDENGSPDEWGF